MMKKHLSILFFLILQISILRAQEYVHKVLILNEGYFDYTLNQSVIPPTIGAYDPILETYINVDTLHAARFASDMVISGDYFYVAADNMLYKYEKNNYNLIDSNQVDGIRNIAVWNDKIFITRGDYDNTTFSPIFFDSYLQVYNVADLSLYHEMDTISGPKWATQNLIVNDDKLYIAINNAYEWGNEKGLIGVIDLNTMSYINEIDLGLDGINPDNMVIKEDYIYTINNKDWSGFSISQLSLLTNSVSTINLASTPTGCGTSCLRGDKINYQISGDTILQEWDLDLLPNTGTPLSINQSFYDLSYDTINNLLYASITDYFSFGSINIYDVNNSLLSSFDCGISPGTIVFDVRTLTTEVFEENVDHSNYFNNSFDLLGRPIRSNIYLENRIILKDNKLLFNIK